MQIKLLANYQITLNARVAAFLLVIIQSCGIRFFSGQGSLITVVLILMLSPNIKYFSRKDLQILLAITVILTLNKLINPSFNTSMLVFQLGLVVSAYLFIISYRKLGSIILVHDFYNALSVIFIHALLGYVLYLVAPSLFKGESGFYYKSFYKIFFIDDVSGKGRNTGLLWEPGLLQLMLNLYLFFSIKNHKSSILLLLICACIATTNSTAGFLVLGLNGLYYFIKNVKKKNYIRIGIIVASLIAFSSALLFIQGNISNKFSDTNTSGLVRYRDFLVGIDLIKEKPIMGHGLFDESYLNRKSYVSNLENTIFSAEYLATSGYLSGGYTNGLLGIFAWFGIPMAIITLYFFYKNTFVDDSFYERLLFFLILSLTFVSEPITNTSLFLIFPFSVILRSKRRIKKSVGYPASFQRAIQ